MDSGASFVLFGGQHLTVIALTVVVPVILVALARSDPTGTTTKGIAWGLGVILLINEAAAFWWRWHVGDIGWDNGLPMHLCDWATFTVVITCWWRKQWAYELSYFWGLAGTLQAIITPNLQYGFPSPWFLIFFISHCGLVAGVLYLTFAFPLRPTWRSIPRAYGWLLFYAACAGLVDWLVGANYGFLAAKPKGASLLDYFGPWPWYIPVTTLLALAFFLLYYAPFAVADIVRARRRASPVQDSVISKT